MPRYNLNHDDVRVLLAGLDLLLIKTTDTKEMNRLLSLRSRLLHRFANSPSGPPAP